MIRLDQAHLQVVARTHPGMTGKNNEDRYAVSAYQISQSDPTPAVLAVLSDGIGGHRAGEVAAEIAVEVLSRRIAESDGSQPPQTLEAAIIDANQQIYIYAQNNPQFQGMGATCACAWIVGNRLYSASIGDSRIYLIRGRGIRQLTTDHTWIQEALERGLLKPEEAKGHPNAHVIRRFLGAPTPPVVDLRLRLSPEEDDQQAESNQGVRLRPGDQLLLCSDGLTDLVKDDEILTVLSENEQDPAVDRLVQMACDRGGHDNITIVSIRVPGREVAGRDVAGRDVAGRDVSGRDAPVREALGSEALAPDPAAPTQPNVIDVQARTRPARRSRWGLWGCLAVLLLGLALGAAAYLGQDLLRSFLPGSAITTTTPAPTLTLPPALSTAVHPVPSATQRPTRFVPPTRPATAAAGTQAPRPTLTAWPTNTRQP